MTVINGTPEFSQRISNSVIREDAEYEEGVWKVFELGRAGEATYFLSVSEGTGDIELKLEEAATVEGPWDELVSLETVPLGVSRVYKGIKYGGVVRLSLRGSGNSGTVKVSGVSQ